MFDRFQIFRAPGLIDGKKEILLCQNGMKKAQHLAITRLEKKRAMLLNDQ